MSGGCSHSLHLELLHFAMQSLPLMIVLSGALVEEGEEGTPKCAAGGMEGPGDDGEPQSLFEGEDCTEDAWCAVGFPGLDKDTDEACVGSLNLCRRHLALLVLQGDELVTPIGS